MTEPDRNLDPRTLPADRGDVDTERPHPDGAALETLATAELIHFLATDQHRAVHAVEAATAELAALADAAVAAMENRGRLIYLGAGTSGRLGVLDASECPPTFNADPETIVGVIAGGDASLRRSSEGAEDDLEVPMRIWTGWRSPRRTWSSESPRAGRRPGCSVDWSKPSGEGRPRR